MPAILLTRPNPSAARFAENLNTRLGAVEIVQSPLLKIIWQAVELPNGMPIFTSRNGVEGFQRSGGVAQGPCWCVGGATAEQARKAGFDAQSADGDAAGLIEAILGAGEQGPMCHVRGVHTRGDLALTLRKNGLRVEEAVVYEQVIEDLTDEALTLLDGDKPVVLPLFSPRTAAQFAKVHHGGAPLLIAAMSGAVLDALDGLRFDGIAVADRPDAQAMADATERLFAAALQLEGVSDPK